MTAPPRHPDSLLGITALVSLGAIAAALISQHAFDMEPCPWCVLQRVVFLAIALAALIGLAWRQPFGHRLAGALVTALAAGGIASALWQHYFASASASCNLTLADRIVGALRLDSLVPDVFAARASCADAAVNLFGMPYEFWSLLLFLGLAVAGWRLLKYPG